MSTLELELYSESARREERKRTAFEYVTALVIPSLALIASAAAVNSHPRITITLIVLACASFVAGLFPPVHASVRRWNARRAAEAVAETAFPEIKKFVRRFEDFVDGRQNNTLHAIVQSDLCQGNGAIYNTLYLPDMGIWTGFRNFFVERIEQEKPTLLALRRDLLEFHHLVGTYNNLCVATIFERLPAELKAGMTAKARSSLNSFQQRLSGFLSDYQDFAKNLAESTPALGDLPRYLSLPKPF
ncbi:MAG: hypothetical protein WCE53_00855 [Candidatus Acidiferrum sp.]